LSIADADVIFFAKGLAAGNKFEVEINEPNVNILAVQGPLAGDLMSKLFGEEIRKLKFFNFDYFELKGHKYFIARSGWSKQGGFEVYVDNDIAGQNLYDYLFEEGKEFNVKPGCPNLIERIEGALLSYGNDFDNRDNPFEANFDKFIHLDSDVDFLGKEKLKKIQEKGITRKLMGVKIEHNKIDMYCEKTLFADNKEVVGYVRSATFSPTFNKVIGIAMINKPYWNAKNQFNIEINEKIYVGSVCDLPLV
jgi:dimethylsulfoniopropionate demethylase